MIPIFKKLDKEGLLKQEGKLLDLGSGNGVALVPFLTYGYHAVLVDKDKDALSEAESLLKQSGNNFELLNTTIEDFEFKDSYDGVIISHVLPFVKDKEVVARIVKTAFDKLNKNGFLYVSFFGPKDQWATERADTMSFYAKDEAINILGVEPYFTSEDYGTGTTRKGGIKTWHVFHFLYIK